MTRDVEFTEISTTAKILVIVLFGCIVRYIIQLMNNNNNSNINATKTTLYLNSPRRHISWDEYFMSVAQLASKRSKDPVTQVGACIVNRQNKIVATGYNGMPNGINDNSIPWVKKGPFLETKYAYVVHAELNAILNSILTDQTGCRLYVSLFPCNECAKAIIQSGIRHVIYLSDKHKDKDSTKASKVIFNMAGVKTEQYQNSIVEIDYNNRIDEKTNG